MCRAFTDIIIYNQARNNETNYEDAYISQPFLPSFRYYNTIQYGGCKELFW